MIVDGVHRMDPMFRALDRSADRSFVRRNASHCFHHSGAADHVVLCQPRRDFLAVGICATVSAHRVRFLPDVL